MDLKYTTYGTGNKKILFDVEILNNCGIELQNINKNNEYTFYFLERNQFVSLFKHNILNRVSYKNLDLTYKRSIKLKAYYDALFTLCLEESITHIIFTSTGQYWHPDFLKQLKENGIIISLSTADDDTNTINYCSLLYTKYYDFHFHAGIMFDKKGTTIADKLKEHGGNPIWIPLGARQNHINDNIDFENRDIDVCYIGNVNPPKLFRLSKLKKHFCDRVKLYGA